MMAGRILVAIACWSLLGGCALPSSLPAATDATPPAGSMLVVGKIELDPPFSSEAEQEFHWSVVGDGAIRNRVLIATGQKPRPIQAGRLHGDDWQGTIDTKWGEYFAVIAPRAPLYLNGVAVPLDVLQQEYFWFPGGLVVRPPDDGSTLYIGTLRYVRDDFNRIVDIDVVDDREEAGAFLLQRFGSAAHDLDVSL